MPEGVPVGMLRCIYDRWNEMSDYLLRESTSNPCLKHGEERLCIHCCGSSKGHEEWELVL